MAGLASINVKFKVDLKEFSKEMQNQLREIDKFGQKMQSVGRGLSAAITAPVLLAGGAAIKFASDYEESMNKVDVAFKTSSGQVKTFAKDTLQNFGIAEGSALEMASLFGDMATSMGLPQAAAAKMSTSLVGLAGDLSSFKNIGIEQAQTALAGIFTGETESLKKLGIVMTEAALQEYAYAQGIRTKVADMGQAEKVQLRYNYVLEKTKNAQGDFARTGGGAANQMRIFQEALKQLAQQFGAIILPAFTSILNKVNGMIVSFSGLSEGTKRIIVSVAGLAAVLGPLALGLGAIAATLPAMAVGFKMISGAILPIVAGAVLLWGLVSVLRNASGATKEVVTEQQKLNGLYAQAAVSARQETTALEQLYKSATDVKKSTKERKEAVDELQNLYPAYFKNIDDEVIKNGNAAKTYYALRDAIFAKARASAIESELQKRANDRISKELEIQENIAKARQRVLDLQTKGQESSNAPTVGGQGAFVSQADRIKEAMRVLGSYKTDLNKFYADAKKEDALLLSAKTENDAKSALLRQNELDLINASGEAIKGRAELEKKLIPGTIAFYEEQIKKLKEQQDQATTTAASYYLLGNQIAKIQEKINKLQAPRLEAIDAPKVSVKTDFSLSGMSDAMLKDLEAKAGGIKSVLESSASNWVDYGSAVGDSLQQLAANAATGFGETLGAVLSGTAGLGDILSGLLGMISNFMKDLGKSLVQIAVANIALKKAFANPFAALAAGIALIALGSAFQDKMSSGPQRFENGGIVGGSSFYGDKIMARVNSGELILNQKQQSSLYGQLNSPGGPIVMIPDVKLKGEDIYVSFGRYEKKKNRLG